MTHSFINIVIELTPEQEQPVSQALDALGNPLKEPLKSIIDDFSRLHFFSLTVVPSDVNTAPFLVFELSADGDEESLLEELANAVGQHVDAVFAPLKAPTQPLSKFWLDNRVKTSLGFFGTPGVAHDGSPGMSVQRIREEAEQAQLITRAFHQIERSPSALETLMKIRKTVDIDCKPKPCPMLEPGKPGSILSGVLSNIVNLVTTLMWPLILLALIMSGWMSFASLEGYSVSSVLTAIIMTLFTTVAGSATLIIISTALAYRKLRQLETTDAPDDSPPDLQKMSAIRAREDHYAQNHLAGVSIMKPGLVRTLALRLVFWLVATLKKSLYRPGFLGDIGTIHFARWFIIPGTNRLLFFSNYGGSWESYLEDFINKASNGLTGVWSNTVGFPRTNNLVLDGATDGDRFKRWARRQQNPTLCWYCAYPTLTTATIRNNAAIVQGFAGISTETEARDWLMLFGSQVLPRTELQSDNIQGLLFGGFGPLPCASCLTLSLPEDTLKSKQWLNAVLPLIHFGDHRPSGKDNAFIIALSATGLKKLGLTSEEMTSFPHAFVDGMANRAAILGDHGKNDPSAWLWGGERKVDAALLIYSPNPETLEQCIQQENTRLQTHGGELVYTVPLKQLPPKGTPIREPFGFVDGVSQQVIRGIGRHKPGTNDLHIIEPGEFIMGYPDGLGTYPQTPSTPAINDSDNDLYSTPNSWPEQRPNFSESLANQQRDLGRDGSFMVIRQLEQDYQGFQAMLKEQAQSLNEQIEGIDITPEWLGAKMIGRWQDGSSLVRNPYYPASEKYPDAKPDNDFLFGKEDPQGLRCPFGSHIRRANPRDSQAPKSKEQINITNRHRILRAGRIYEDGDQQGLLFVALNGDIERQFEFIQQTWLNNANFHGLNREMDPLFSQEPASQYSIPMRDGSRCAFNMQSFITTKGGEYFFLPGKQTLRFLTRER